MEDQLRYYYSFLELLLEPDGEEVVADAVGGVGRGEELFFGEAFEGGLDGAGAVEGVLFDESRRGDGFYCAFFGDGLQQLLLSRRE